MPERRNKRQKLACSGIMDNYEERTTDHWMRGDAQCLASAVLTAYIY